VNLTDVRAAIRDAVASGTGLPPGNVSVRVSSQDYGDGTTDFAVTVTLDPNWVQKKHPGATPEEILDTWLSPVGEQSMKERLEADQSLNDLAQVVVTKSSGHRLFQGQEGSPRSGAEWTLRTLA